VNPSAPSQTGHRRRVSSVFRIVGWALGIALATFLSGAFLRNFVVCYGMSCLDDRIIAANNSSTRYLFKGKYCFFTAELLSPGRYAHTQYSSLAGLIIQTTYLVAPSNRLWVIPSENNSGPILTIEKRNLAPARTEQSATWVRDIAFCGDDVRVIKTQAGLSIEQPRTGEQR
jgi:hypothetical protein